MEGRSLAITFGEWFIDNAGIFAPMARLETAIAARRRAENRRLKQRGLHLTSGVDVMSAPMGVLKAYESVQARRAASESAFLQALVTHQNRKSLDTPWEDDQTEHLIIDMSPGGGLGTASESLVRFLNTLRYGQSEADALQWLTLNGLEDREAHELVEELIGEGLINRILTD